MVARIQRPVPPSSRRTKTIIVLENQARSSFSVPTLMNISEKLFDPYVSDTTVVESGAEDTEDETMP